MKTTSLPSPRVTPEMRRDAESLLESGESLSSFVLSSVQRQIEERRAQRLFIERGIANGERARATGKYVSAEDVMKNLARRLKDAKAKVAKLAA